MQILRRSLTWLLCGSIALGTLAGCGGGTTSQAEGSTAPAADTAQAADTASTDTPASEEAADPSVADSAAAGGTVNVWTWEPQDNQQAIIDDFNKDFPDINIVFTTVASADMAMKVQTALASDAEVPDAAWCEISQRGKLMALDCWEDLSGAPYNVDRGDMLDFMIPLSQTPSGVLAGIEVSPPVAGVAYKRSLAKEYFGTDDPKEMEAIFSSWDAFIEKGVEVKEKSGGTVYMYANGSHVADMIRHQNAEPFVKEDGTLNLGASLGETFDKLLAMKQNGILDNIELDTPALDAAYAGENHIFYPCATWSPTWEFKAKDPNGTGNWALMLPPGGGFLRGGTVVAIPQKAANKEGAFEYLRWNYLSQAGAVSNRDHLDYMTVYKPIYEDASFYSAPDDFFGGQDVLQTFAQDLIPSVKVPRQVTKYDTEVLDAMKIAIKEIDNSADGNVDKAKLFEDMQKDVLNKLPELKGE